jgi:hypothetical protein
MDYKLWVELFGKSADDVQVREALKLAGITKVLKIGRDELSVAAEIPGEGSTILFTDETILYRNANGVLGRPILSAILLVMQHTRKYNLYKGPLPYQLTIDSSQSALRSRLGAPVEMDDEYRRDTWSIDGLLLTIIYSKDLQSVNRVSLSLPDSQ